MNPANIHADDMDQVLQAVRRVPEEAQGAAFAFIASRLRIVPNHDVFTIHEICTDALAKYGARLRTKEKELPNGSSHQN